MPICCPHCSREFPGSKLNARHLAKCSPTTSPTVLPCLCGQAATSMTQMKRHRQGCPTWLERDRGAVQGQRMAQTNRGRYGVPSAASNPEVQARTKATNRERYGADNPFQRESALYAKVQESLVGKRPVLSGDANPFASPDVKAKIRQHWQNKHGVNGPQQVSDIRAATKATNLERYGGEMRGSPLLRERIAQTNLERYGFVEPSCNLEVQDRIQATNLERYGVPWTAMDTEVRRKQLDTMEANYGSHFFASDEGQAEVRGVLKERYGVEFPSQIEGYDAKAKATFLRRYGVEHPLQLEFFNEKRFATCIRKYGTPFPGRPPIGPNLLEARVGAMSPELVFTGDGAYWKRLPSLGVFKNPDFILPGSEPGHPKRGVRKVVEVFGDFWHSRMFTGKANFDHEQELIAGFLVIGIECMVLWESEVKADPKGVQERLQAFLQE